MVGANTFRPDLALLVTWENMSYLQATTNEQISRVIQIP